MHKPELLLLDEPTSAVDPESRRDFWEKLFELADGGTTILVSTHYMDEAERCHRLAILDHGNLVADGTPKELTAKLQGRTFLIHAESPRKAKEALDDQPDVLSVAQIGNELRVLMRQDNESIDDLKSRLRHVNATTDVESVDPNLEDVFVVATRKHASQQEQPA